jgi:uncharacterized protein (UPF0261 family)
MTPINLIKQKKLLIIANLDTRGFEFKLVKELIESRGPKGLVLDFSTDQKPYLSGEISCKEVARVGGVYQGGPTPLPYRPG